LSAGNTPFIGSNRLHICLWGGGAEEEEEEEEEKCKEQMKKKNTRFLVQVLSKQKKYLPVAKKQSARTPMKNEIKNEIK